MTTLRARSSAKINLSLDILKRLPNGYHTIRSLVHPVGLWDEVEMSFEEHKNVLFACNDETLQDESNLCVRAFAAWREAMGITVGATIRLHKNIPFGAGLGGGSGNAAAILRLANSYATQKLSEEQLLAVAAKLGADVPLFLQPSPVLMEGIGDQITPVSALAGWVVIVKPLEGFSTPAMYRAWDESGLQSQQGTEALLKEWEGGDVQRVAPHLTNDLERAAREVSALPGRCVEVLREAGARGARMSGSGSACFGLCATQDECRGVEERVAEQLAKDVLLQGATTFVAPLVAQGVEILSSEVP